MEPEPVQHAPVPMVSMPAMVGSKLCHTQPLHYSHSYVEPTHDDYDHSPYTGYSGGCYYLPKLGTNYDKIHKINKIYDQVDHLKKMYKKIAYGYNDPDPIDDSYCFDYNLFQKKCTKRFHMDIILLIQ